MNLCFPCNRTFQTYTKFVKHMNTAHGIDKFACWRRVEACHGDPVTAVRTMRGRWMLYRQGSLNL